MTSNDLAKTVLALYILGGSFLYLGICSEKTGHQSADLYLGKAHMTQVEKTFYNPIFKKVNIETKLKDKN